MRLTTWVLGYHGCDRSVGEAILKGDTEVLLSSNDHDWLGKGAYFWENSYSRALEWATALKEHPSRATIKITNPYVIGAIIDPGNCLDLCERDSLSLVREAHLGLSQWIKKEGVSMPVNGKGYPSDIDLVERRLDCAVLNYLHSIREDAQLQPFDTVRGLFTEGIPLFEGSKFQAKTHLQWCVLDPLKSVHGYFLPRETKRS